VEPQSLTERFQHLVQKKKKKYIRNGCTEEDLRIKREV
jgi:hypothetical protein